MGNLTHLLSVNLLKRNYSVFYLKRTGYDEKTNKKCNYSYTRSNNRQSRESDMLINGSTIEAIAPHLEAEKHEEYEEIDATDRIIMPGFVDSHRHTWESLIRNIGVDWSLQTYLGEIYYGNYGSLRRPQDDYIGNLIGALEALDAGVTTLLDWTMIQSPDHTHELVRGLDDAGIRAVFAHGSPGDASFWNNDSAIDNAEDARRAKARYFSSDDQLLTMGLAIRGPEFSAWETSVREIQLARELDAVCSMHLGFGTWGTPHSRLRA